MGVWRVTCQKADMKFVTRKAEANGHNLTSAPATRSTNSEAHSQGGVLLATRKHLRNVPMHEDKWGDGYHKSQCEDIAARGVCMQGGDVIFAAAYCRHEKWKANLDNCTCGPEAESSHLFWRLISICHLTSYKSNRG